MNHLDLVNEVVASTASPQELRFVGFSPLTETVLRYKASPRAFEPLISGLLDRFFNL